MNNNQNIFEKLSQQNEQSSFDESISIPRNNSETKFLGTSQESNNQGNIFDRLAEKVAKRKEDQFTFLQTARDVGEQVASKGVSGVVGAYGNVLDTFGLQTKKQLPGEEAKNLSDFSTLKKIEHTGKTSVSDFINLSDEDTARSMRLPSSKDVQSGIQQTTGIGEGKTPAGRIAGRGAEFVGEGIATGGGTKALLGLGVGGLAGQSIREAGGPEAAASAVEIGSSLAPSVISKKLLPSSKATKDIVESGRKIGLSEAQITPLIQGEKKVSTLSKVARKGSKTKELFRQIKQKLGDSYEAIKNSKQAKVKLPNSDQIKLTKDFSGIRNELSKTLSPSPDKEAALNYIEKALQTLRDVDVTPEYLVNFWQDINKSVKWNSISGGKKALAQLKKPISDILKKTSPKLAEDFEMTNDLYSRYSQISKKLKPDIVDSFLNKGEIISGVPAGLALAQGNPWALAGLGSEVALRILGREMLINPYFQNIGSKLVKNFNQGSAKAITETVNQVKDYMQRKHPQEDWKFLSEKFED